MKKTLSIPTLRRLPRYYRIICERFDEGKEYIRSSEIACKLDINETQVRKDISVIDYSGKPKIGFNIRELKAHLENFLDLSSVKNSFLIGVGNLGQALARYNGFKKYGLDITAIFDNDPAKVGLNIEGKEVFHINQLAKKIQDENVKILILAIPGDNAQKIVNLAVDNGIRAIWNFAPVNIEVPKHVVVANQDLAVDFITLSLKLDKDLS